jgi:hypothetical protein
MFDELSELQYHPGLYVPALLVLQYLKPAAFSERDAEAVRTDPEA